MKLITHPQEEKILKNINSIRNGPTYDERGLQGVISHLVQQEALVHGESTKYLVDFRVLNGFFDNIFNLAYMAIEGDSFVQEEYADRFVKAANGEGSNIDMICEPWIQAFSEFSPDYVVFAHYTEGMAGALAHRLTERLEKEVTSVYLSDTSEKGIRGIVGQDGLLEFKPYVDKIEPGKNAIIADRLMDPLTIGGIAKTVQQEDVYVLGVAGLIATQKFDPDFALPIAKIEMEGWMDSEGRPFSPSIGKYLFYFPERTKFEPRAFKMFPPGNEMGVQFAGHLNVY